MFFFISFPCENRKTNTWRKQQDLWGIVWKAAALPVSVFCFSLLLAHNWSLTVSVPVSIHPILPLPLDSEVHCSICRWALPFVHLKSFPDILYCKWQGHLFLQTWTLFFIFCILLLLQCLSGDFLDSQYYGCYSLKWTCFSHSRKTYHWQALLIRSPHGVMNWL